MNKNFGLIVAVVFLLLMGTGTFVFANATEEDYSDYGDMTTNQNTTQVEDKVTSEENNIVDNNIVNQDTEMDNNTTTLVTNDRVINQNGNKTNVSNVTSQNPNTNNGNSGSNTNVDKDNENGTNNSGNNGGNNGGTGNDNNSSNDTEEEPEPVLPSFQFVNGGTFSNSEIIINDPNYGYMTVYNRFTGKTDREESNKYTVTMNTLYTFTIYDKNGNVMQTAKMTFDNVAPNVTSVATSSTGSEKVIPGKIYDKVKITFTDNELSVIKRIYDDGHEEILKQYTINDFDYGKFEKTFTESGHYKIVAYDVALNSRSIEFTIK